MGAANFTIDRLVEPDDNVGCTDFETTQTDGDPAVIGGGANTVDGDIIWYIKADPGYTVDITNFSVTGATLITGPWPLTTTVWDTFAVIPPILGIVFEQITATKIKVILYLHPNQQYNITGPVFSMPNNDVNVTVPIDGCAELVPAQT